MKMEKTYVNKKLEETTDYFRDEVIGSDASILLKEKDIEKSERVINQIKKRIKESNTKIELDDLKWNGYNSNVATFLKEERKIAKNNYPYFKSMRDFARKNSLSWEHMDIFVTRLTSQNKLKDTLNIEEYIEGKNNNSFLKNQLDLFFSLLSRIRPKVIVVENAFARDLLKKTRLKNNRYDLTPKETVDPNTGYQTIKLDSETPIFFSGMLSGQRALDKGSRQRLEWHILQFLKKN